MAELNLGFDKKYAERKREDTHQSYCRGQYVAKVLFREQSENITVLDGDRLSVWNSMIRCLEFIL